MDFYHLDRAAGFQLCSCTRPSLSFFFAICRVCVAVFHLSLQCTAWMESLSFAFAFSFWESEACFFSGSLHIWKLCFKKTPGLVQMWVLYLFHPLSTRSTILIHSLLILKRPMKMKGFIFSVQSTVCSILFQVCLIMLVSADHVKTYIQSWWPVQLVTVFLL